MSLNQTMLKIGQANQAFGSVDGAPGAVAVLDGVISTYEEVGKKAGWGKDTLQWYTRLTSSARDKIEKSMNSHDPAHMSTHSNSIREMLNAVHGALCTEIDGGDPPPIKRDYSEKRAQIPGNVATDMEAKNAEIEELKAQLAAAKEPVKKKGK